MSQSKGVAGIAAYPIQISANQLVEEYRRRDAQIMFIIVNLAYIWLCKSEGDAGLSKQVLPKKMRMSHVLAALLGIALAEIQHPLCDLRVPVTEYLLIYPDIHRVIPISSTPQPCTRTVPLPLKSSLEALKTRRLPHPLLPLHQANAYSVFTAAPALASLEPHHLCFQTGLLLSIGTCQLLQSLHTHLTLEVKVLKILFLLVHLRLPG